MLLHHDVLASLSLYTPASYLNVPLKENEDDHYFGNVKKMNYFLWSISLVMVENNEVFRLIHFTYYD